MPKARERYTPVLRFDDGERVFFIKNRTEALRNEGTLRFWLDRTTGSEGHLARAPAGAASDKKRRQALELFERGFGYKAVADILVLSVNTVRDWSRLHKQGRFSPTMSRNQYRYTAETKAKALVCANAATLGGRFPKRRASILQPAELVRSGRSKKAAKPKKRESQARSLICCRHRVDVKAWQNARYSRQLDLSATAWT